MTKQIFSFICLLFVSAGISAAGVSNTTFTGTSYSNGFTVGSSSDSASYSGSAASSEFANGVLSTRHDVFGGSSNASERFRQRTDSTSQFSGTINSNGIVARTTETVDTQTSTNGRSVARSEQERSGSYEATSKAYGGFFQGIIGSESGTYGSESSERTRTRYGSDQNSNTYSVNSYVID